ncbi:hypothetical protein NQZ68_039897 [Dissostichus eleginoides]|nr:hypothetical protein NQZ68_039897 [Dissostichus eleginoides]
MPLVDFSEHLRQKQLQNCFSAIRAKDLVIEDPTPLNQPIPLAEQCQCLPGQLLPLIMARMLPPSPEHQEFLKERVAKWIVVGEYHTLMAKQIFPKRFSHSPLRAKNSSLIEL